MVGGMWLAFVVGWRARRVRENGGGGVCVAPLKKRDRRMGPKLGGVFPSFLLALHCPSGGRGTGIFRCSSAVLSIAWRFIPLGGGWW